MDYQKKVKKFYAPANLHCLPRTDGGFGIFTPNPDLNKWPICVGIAATKKGAWQNAYERIVQSGLGTS